MKKVYSFLIAAAAGSMISASAFTGYKAFDKADVPMQIHSQKIERIDRNALKPNLKLEGVESRDGQYVDVTTFNQWLYYDYFYNWTSDGAERPSFLGQMSSYHTDITDNGDGTLTVGGFAGYDYSFDLVITEEGGLEVPLGQEVGILEDDGYRLVLAGLDDDGEPLITGSLPFEVYSNAIVLDDYLGIWVYDLKTGDELGPWCLNVYNFFTISNATLKYTFTYNNGTTIDVLNPIFYEYIEADPEDTSSTDMLMLSNVMHFNEGTNVYLEYVPISADEAYFIAFDQVAYPSQQQSDGSYTGDFYLSYSFIDGGKEYFNPEITLGEETTFTDLNNNSYPAVQWPVENSSLSITDVTGWIVASYSGYAFGDATTATLILDYLGDGEGVVGGVKNIINDSTVGGEKAYYNLQGVQVNNPEAGQIYIVKEGNKAYKQIMR